MALVVILVVAFALALVVTGLLLFPALLDSLGNATRRITAQAGARGQRWSERVRPRPDGRIERSRIAGPGTLDDLGAWVRGHGPLIAGALVLLLLPVAILLLLSDQRRLAGFEDHAQAENRVVTSLLEGEQLVPPPPLPPDVFVTREVEQVRPFLGGADREWQRLDPEFSQTLLRLFKTMETKGYAMVLIEGYRSPERQAFLQAKGGNVTNAGAWQSYHQFGLAADCAFFRDGKLVISERDPWAAEGYRLYGEAADAAGLTWGGHWTFHDLGHIEQHRAGILRSGARHS